VLEQEIFSRERLDLIEEQEEKLLRRFQEKFRRAKLERTLVECSKIRMAGLLRGGRVQ